MQPIVVMNHNFHNLLSPVIELRHDIYLSFNIWILTLHNGPQQWENLWKYDVKQDDHLYDPENTASVSKW